ncbi:UvrD-helicase domain-containing protein [Halanaerobium congolense]|uniref:DNA 3'-5' helicase n=1 Tax=Halanaerobium congolense TaxID=54121 RepID=A0A4R7E2P5_9FIRM|nr:ATP-dependent helicase [Halanaerobium congolense]TDS28035.1 superfamily I DNA/RNA helicase [Halanaerobium congolense]
MAHLNEKQKTAVNEYGNVFVSAPPGSGKTRTLIARAEKKLENYDKPVALITYTNAAADEMRNRIDSEKKIFVGTIHKFCLEYILRPFGWLYDWENLKVISFDDKKEIKEEIKKRFGSKIQYRFFNNVRKKLNGEIDLSNIDYSFEIADFYFDYLRKNELVDFNEILYRAYKILDDNQFIRTSLASKFTEILVDEFQDINYIQYEIIKLLDKDKLCSFFMVGDFRQSIMRFAGAIDLEFEVIERDFNCRIIQLNKTYRSTDNIVDSYVSLFNNHPKIDNRAEVKDVKIKVNIKSCNGSYKCRGCSDSCKNNVNIIEDILNFLLEEGIEESEIAILSPWRNDAKKIGDKLAGKFNIVGPHVLPHSVKGIKSTSVFQLIKSLSKYFVKSSVNNLRNIKTAIENYLLENNISVMQEKINLLTKNLLITLFENENVKIIKAFKNIEFEFNRHFGVDQHEFDEIINKIRLNRKEGLIFSEYLNMLSGIDGIFNQTIYAAKGLEFDAVILNRIDEGRIPYSSTPSEEDIDNGRKLFYVGLSRAKRYLAVIHADDESRFISELRNFQQGILE